MCDLNSNGWWQHKYYKALIHRTSNDMLVVYAVKIAAPSQMYLVTYLLTSDVFMWLLAHTYVNTTAERRCRYFN